MKHAYFYETKIGRILIEEEEGCITRLSMSTEKTEGSEEITEADYVITETELIKETSRQLNEYLDGSRKEFDVALNPSGTIFQKKVWEALRAIPYGETRSYKQIAEAVGNTKACRAVGMANHNNPIICIIPCHRVIGTNGKLVGYAGGLDVKEMLLNMEKVKERKQEDE
jgi:methylated-DNA-[protein]-cysteine S-methyltransferase